MSAVVSQHGRKMAYGVPGDHVDIITFCTEISETSNEQIQVVLNDGLLEAKRLFRESMGQESPQLAVAL